MNKTTKIYVLKDILFSHKHLEYKNKKIIIQTFRIQEQNNIIDIKRQPAIHCGLNIKQFFLIDLLFPST